MVHSTSFRVAAGRVLRVVGPNGAGKSTLLRLLYRFQEPHTGQVQIEGQNIWSLTARQSAQRIAAVLQEQTSAPGLSLREILALGRTPHRAKFAFAGAGGAQIVDEVLEKLKLGAFADRDFGSLSGGERQRFMIARAMAKEPHLLILDEPANHLDVRHQLEVVSLIRSLKPTIVVSMHDLNIAFGVCDDVLVLKDGTTQGFGAPETLLTDRLVSDTFRVDARREHLSPNGAPHFAFTFPN